MNARNICSPLVIFFLGGASGDGSLLLFKDSLSGILLPLEFILRFFVISSLASLILQSEISSLLLLLLFLFFSLPKMFFRSGWVVERNISSSLTHMALRVALKIVLKPNSSG